MYNLRVALAEWLLVCYPPKLKGLKFIMDILKKIGNVVAAILLGDTRDKIIETRKDVEYIKKEVDENLKPTLKDVDKKVFVLWEERLAIQHSPVQLNPRGVEILEKSGIKKLIDDGFPQFLDSIKEKKPANAYQVQEFSKQVVVGMKNNPGILPKLQEGAYSTGVDVDSVLFVGSIYLRNLALPKFNFKLEDIDGQKTPE